MMEIGPTDAPRRRISRDLQQVRAHSKNAYFTSAKTTSNNQQWNISMSSF